MDKEIKRLIKAAALLMTVMLTAFYLLLHNAADMSQSEIIIKMLFAICFAFEIFDKYLSYPYYKYLDKYNK